MFFSGKGRESSDTNVETSVVVHTQVLENTFLTNFIALYLLFYIYTSQSGELKSGKF